MRSSALKYLLNLLTLSISVKKFAASLKGENIMSPKCLMREICEHFMPRKLHYNAELTRPAVS